LFIDRSKIHEIADRVTTVLSPEGFSCIDAEWEAPSRTLRLFIDHSAGMTLDECAKVSNLLQDSPEIDQLLAFDFNLEISSPGIERPIRTMDHFKEAHLGQFQIDVKLTEKFKDRRKGVGYITDIGPDDMISMKTTEGPWSFPWNMVLKASKVVDWNKVHERPV
jgi:ribosome maturation factor RimP